jgi:predicted DNA-binding transcriptional regulator YafY
MRADRLLSILMLLQSQGRMTAHELAEQLEVSERTIYRDFEALSIAGIPIYTERGPGGGCELLDGYQTRLTGLTEPEVRALFLANSTASLADLGLDQALDQAMLKLSAVLPASSRSSAEQIRQRVHFDASWWYHNDESTKYLPTIQEATYLDRKLSLLYDGELNEANSELLIDVYGLVSKARVWYLVGYSASQMRVLRVSRIQQAHMLEESFLRPNDFDLASFWSNYCAEIEAQPGEYAIPLRLAPEDAPQIHETLSSWGYMLIEQDEILLQAAQPTCSTPQARPRSFTQRKKKGFNPTQSILLRARKNRRVPSQKKRIAREKNLYALKKKEGPRSIKKTHVPSQKKPCPIKKTNFIFLALRAHTLCA